MFNLFKKGEKNQPHFDVSKDENGIDRVVIRQEGQITAAGQLPLASFIAEKSNLSLFKGTIEHLYESDFTGNKEKCPLCGTDIVRMISSISYATQESSRIMTGQAGLFCPSCPTAVVDDDFMRDSIDKSKFVYRGAFSIEDGVSGVSIIKTINGQKPIFVLSEDEDVLGIVQSVNYSQEDDDVYVDPRLFRQSSKGTGLTPQEIEAARKKKAKKKAKNKAAKKSKKANR
jgi:hypothetical protein